MHQTVQLVSFIGRRTVERPSTLHCKIERNLRILLVYECVKAFSLIRRKFVCERCSRNVGREESEEAQERDGREHARSAADVAARPTRRQVGGRASMSAQRSERIADSKQSAVVLRRLFSRPRERTRRGGVKTPEFRFRLIR